MPVIACAACGAENPAEARFCMGCGKGLARACPTCGTEAPPEARFCMGCGNALDGGAVTQAAPAGTPAQTPAPAPADPTIPPEERRQVTVLFADLSGYTAMSEGRDPEVVKALVERCLLRLGDEVERHGGRVDKYIGDNVMAIFGAPVAHEDDAERAVRAALAMQDAMAEINEGIPDADLNLTLRVGLNTGEVMAGAVGDRYTVTGDAVNTASRLQSAGRPQSVTVGERTWRLTRSVIEYHELEPLVLKGKSQPVPAWEAVCVGAALPGAGSFSADAPLVGRQHELGLIQSAFSTVLRDRRPHMVTVFGQAGVGKSRLLAEFTNGVRDAGDAVVREGRCVPYGSNLAYWALGEVMRGDAGIVDSDSAGEAWEKLHDYVVRLRGDAPDELATRRAALIGRLIGIEPPADIGVGGDGTDPERMRDTMFAAVKGGLDARSTETPLVFVIEDIHWADDGMLDLSEHLAAHVRGPLLIICLARDDLLERRPDWARAARASTALFLEPLTAEQTVELIKGLLPAGAEPAADSIARLADRAEGNPLFAQEMARLLAQGGGHGPDELPDTLQGLLAARIDALDPGERRIVQQASVVGRTFRAASIAEAAREEGYDLDETLARLSEKGIFEQTYSDAGDGVNGDREFAFGHVLIRDVAYSMLPKAVRATKHFEVGVELERYAGDRGDEVVALLAEHYGRAAVLGAETGIPAERLEPITAKAVHFLEAAGDAAVSVFANAEAFSHYELARAAAPASDDLRERIAEKQADVAVRIGRVDAALELWDEALEYHRGHENLERVGDLHRKIGAGLWHKGEGRAAIEHYQKGINLLKDGPPNLELVRLYEEAAWLYMHTGDNMLAIYAAEKALRLAERLGETSAACRAHGIFGRVFGRIGDTEKARENLERSVELARDADESEAIRSLLTLGDHLELSDADYAGASAAYEEALELAERVGDLPAQLDLHAALATLATHRADWVAVDRYLDVSARLVEGEGLAGKLALPAALRGLVAWRDGDWAVAEANFGRAEELANQVGWSEVAFQALFGLATTQRDRGEFIKAAETLLRALDVCERSGLIAQSIQAIAARAVALMLGDRGDAAREAASEAGDLAERLHYPIGKAAAVEARGFTAESPAEGATLLDEARDLWTGSGRPLEAARCDLLAGMMLLASDRDAAAERLEAGAAAYETLGVPRLAERARAAIAPPA